MKKFKKTLLVLLTILAVFGLAACAKKDPKVLFQEAVKKNSELTAMDMEAITNIKMTLDGQEMDVKADMSVKMDHINFPEMQYMMKSKIHLLGQEVDANIFYKDGYYYIDSRGQKLKYPMDLAKLMEQVKQLQGSANLELDYIKDIQAEKSGSDQILTFTADPEKMDAYVQKVLKSTGAGAAGVEGAELKINEASGEYTVNKDGYYTAMKIKMNIDTTAEGKTVNLILDMDATVNNPGKPVMVEIPSTDGYQEVDPADIGS